MNTPIDITVNLTETLATVLRRYVAELNALFKESNELMVRIGGVALAEPITEREALQMLCASALEREQKLQMLQDNRGDPPWIAQEVRKAMQELRNHERP